MEDPIRVAVIGCGYFGRFHADHYARNPRASLVAVVDTDENKARAAAADFRAEPAFDYHTILDKVDAATVAVPTPLHYQVTKALLEAGVHVLLEKPIADTIEDAVRLAKLGHDRKLVLQVGHIERFSSAYRTLSKAITDPLYFESYRIAPWKNRGVEVDVILDLMVHDIDMIIGLVASPTLTVQAVGAPVLGKGVDIANARIIFESGCIANVTASRVSYKTERRMRVFACNRYLNCDFGEGRIFAYHLRGDPMTQGLAAITTETYDLEKQDSLASEIDAFLDCVITGHKPVVDGWAGCEALRVANMINESIVEHLNKVRAASAGAAPSASLP
jgi:predicted dehydrogenase